MNEVNVFSAINTRGAWALIRRTWASWMAQRGFFWLLAFGWMIPPLVYLFVWSAAAGTARWEVCRAASLWPTI